MNVCSRKRVSRKPMFNNFLGYWRGCFACLERASINDHGASSARQRHVALVLVVRFSAMFKFNNFNSHNAR